MILTFSYYEHFFISLYQNQRYIKLSFFSRTDTSRVNLNVLKFRICRTKADIFRDSCETIFCMIKPNFLYFQISVSSTTKKWLNHYRIKFMNIMFNIFKREFTTTPPKPVVPKFFCRFFLAQTRNHITKLINPKYYIFLMYW